MCMHNVILLDETNWLHLKITPTLDDPPTVEDYHVPIFTCTKEDIESPTWDLTIEQVHVNTLASSPGLLPKLPCACL